MHRIDHATRNIDEHGSGKDGFTEGDPVAGVPPTVVTDDWLDDVQENLCRAVELADVALVKGDDGQLEEAIRRCGRFNDFATTEESNYSAERVLAHGLYTVPANSCYVGERIRLTCAGYAINDDAVLTRNFTLQIRLGGLSGFQLFTLSPVTLIAVSGSFAWHAEIDLLMHEVDSSPVYHRTLKVDYTLAGTGDVRLFASGPVGGSPDLTADKDLVVTGSFSTADADCKSRVTMFSVERFGQLI